MFIKRAGLLTCLLHSLSLPVIHSGMFQVAQTYSGGNRAGLSPNFPFKLYIFSSKYSTCLIINMNFSKYYYIKAENVYHYQNSGKFNIPAHFLSHLVLSSQNPLQKTSPQGVILLIQFRSFFFSKNT